MPVQIVATASPAIAHIRPNRFACFMGAAISRHKGMGGPSGRPSRRPPVSERFHDVPIGSAPYEFEIVGRRRPAEIMLGVLLFVLVECHFVLLGRGKRPDKLPSSRYEVVGDGCKKPGRITQYLFVSYNQALYSLRFQVPERRVLHIPEFDHVDAFASGEIVAPRQSPVMPDEPGKSARQSVDEIVRPSGKGLKPCDGMFCNADEECLPCVRRRGDVIAGWNPVLPSEFGIHCPLTVQLEQRIAERSRLTSRQVFGQQSDVFMDAIVALKAVNGEIPAKELRDEIGAGVPFAVYLCVHAKLVGHNPQIETPPGACTCASNTEKRRLASIRKFVE
ncbi:MAG: hypothetical protein ACREHV_02740 [Rhizomicrobium sp.]